MTTSTMARGVGRFVALSWLAACVAVASAALPDLDAVRSAIAKTDLRKLSLPKDVEPRQVSSVRAMFNWPAAVEPAMNALRAELEKAGWREKRGEGMPQTTDQYAQALFEQDGCQLSVSLSASEGQTMVNLLNMGPVDCRKLPRVAGAKPLYESAFTTLLVTDLAVAEAAKLVREQLLKEGWKQYGTDRPTDPAAESQSFDFCYGPVNVGAYISKAPAQGGRTAIQYSTRLLSAELPWPDDAEKIEFLDEMRRVRAVSPAKFDEVFAFYRDELKKLGWTMDAGWIHVGETFADVVWVNGDATERIRLHLTGADDGTKIDLDGISNESFRELVAEALAEDRQREQAEMPEEKAEAPAEAELASVRTLPLPPGAIKVEYDADEEEIRFKTADSPKQVRQFFKDKLEEAGWSDGGALSFSSKVAASLGMTGPQEEELTILATRSPIGRETEVTIGVDNMSFAEAAHAPDEENPAGESPTDEMPAEEEPAAEAALVAELKDGFPVPDNYTSFGSEGSLFRRTLMASTPAPLANVIEFYQAEMPKAGFKLLPGEKRDERQAVFHYQGPQGNATLTLRGGDETAIEWATRDTAAAKKAGILPKPGMARVVFANDGRKAVRATFGGKPISIGPGVGVKKPDGPGFDVKPGKYTLKVEPPGGEPLSETFQVGADQTWGVVIGEFGVIPLQLY